MKACWPGVVCVSWVLARGQIEPKLSKVKVMAIFLIELKFMTQPPPSLASQQEKHDCTSAAAIFQNGMMIPNSQSVGEALPPTPTPPRSFLQCSFPRENLGKKSFCISVS